VVDVTVVPANAMDSTRDATEAAEALARDVEAIVSHFRVVEAAIVTRARAVEVWVASATVMVR